MNGDPTHVVQPRILQLEIEQLALEPEDAARLAKAIAAMPADVRAYKQVDVFEPALERLFGAGWGQPQDVTSRTRTAGTSR